MKRRALTGSAFFIASQAAGAAKAMTAVYHQSPDVVSSPLDEGSALLDLTSSTYFSLNAVGALAWDRLSSGATVEQVVAAVTSRYDIAETQCRADMESLLTLLEAKGLVRSGNASA